MSEQEPMNWQFIRLDQFSRPQPPAAQAVRKGIGGFLAQLSDRTPVQPGIELESELVAVPAFLLERVAQAPQPEQFLLGLRSALDAWATRDKLAHPIRVLVYPPFNDFPEALTAWAREVDWWVVEPPAYKEILNGGQDWLNTYQRNPEKPLLIPDLAQLYLRHYAGLDLVRQILDMLWSQKRLCLIGCDSWAWAFLGTALQIDTLLPHPLTLAHCDNQFLESWFLKQAEGSNRFGFAFRQSSNGEYVFPPPGSPEVSTSNYLSLLAATSRGNPGVAWAIWRYSLQYGADEDLDQKALESAEKDRGRTIWVNNLEEINLPEIKLPTQNQLFVLHALLIHSGLPVNELAKILPISAADVMQAVQRLRAAGLIEVVGKCWRVAALGYPSVRRKLSQDGFIVDPL